ncbi:hypothetical protein H7J71_02200 [Mycolicibacterium peregrinum]|uniref:hypothetical protein n=1 Tax=Mycobacteriaceae TaxID=1762 RepID=UPI000AE62F59|nr:hypothetical protein [Mycolicibacterium peregrinum]MCV7200823.1 hypothetical protein [Mycolicibacterium peregrinum]
MQPEVRSPVRTYVEYSRDGALTVELDGDEAVVRVQVEPEVNATWTAQEVSSRVLRLHTVALMRKRCEDRDQMNDRGAGIPPGHPVFPTASEVAEYRHRFINF